MPFKKGDVGNPKGMPPRPVLELKWKEIDRYIAKGTQWAFEVMEGINEDIKAIKKPKDRLDIQMRAFGHLVRLAPQRQVGSEGGPIQVKWQETIVLTQPALQEHVSGDNSLQAETSILTLPQLD